MQFNLNQIPLMVATAGVLFATQVQACLNFRAELESEDSGSVYSGTIVDNGSQTCSISHVETASSDPFEWSCISGYSASSTANGVTITYSNNGGNTYSWTATNVSPPQDGYSILWSDDLFGC